MSCLVYNTYVYKNVPVIYSLIAGEGTVTCLNFTGVECNTFSLCLYFVVTFS